MQGGCLCGAIRYEVGDSLSDISNCHCSMCRRFHGAAYSTYAKVSASDFRWIKGQELLSVYETTRGIGWAFCRNCGSSLGIPSGDALGSITLGTLDADPGVRPGYHMFVGSKAAWHDITDALPQYDAWPPAEGK
jgi:hypothetical protein